MCLIFGWLQNESLIFYICVGPSGRVVVCSFEMLLAISISTWHSLSMSTCSRNSGTTRTLSEFIFRPRVFLSFTLLPFCEVLVIIGRLAREAGACKSSCTLVLIYRIGSGSLSFIFYSVIISKDIHTDGDWYYYFELEMDNDNGGWPESYIMNRRSEKMYSSFEQCKQAFVNDYADAAGGCAKNCEILPQSAYALRLHTCEDVVGF